MAIETEFEEALVRNDMHDGGEDEDSLDEKGAPEGLEQEDLPVGESPSTLGAVAEYILPIVSKPAKLLQTTLFSIFGKPEPPSAQKSEKVPFS